MLAVFSVSIYRPQVRNPLWCCFFKGLGVPYICGILYSISFYREFLMLLAFYSSRINFAIKKK